MPELTEMEMFDAGNRKMNATLFMNVVGNRVMKQPGLQSSLSYKWYNKQKLKLLLVLNSLQTVLATQLYGNTFHYFKCHYVERRV